jgi:aspartyl-tRNA(Asn)/glutamyl-tRNA(Gln) amidotransferase subunit C
MLDKSNIQHVANLARLKITDLEAEKYGSELSRVFGYIDELKAVEVAGLEPTAQVTGLVNKLRSDAVRSWDEDERDLALQQAEVLENNLVKVPKII